MYILEALVLPDCNPQFNGEQYRGEWGFPCGLRVTSELAHRETEHEWGYALGDAHRAHHIEQHKATPWVLIETREVQDGGWIRLIASCDC